MRKVAIFLLSFRVKPQAEKTTYGSRVNSIKPLSDIKSESKMLSLDPRTPNVQDFEESGEFSNNTSKATKPTLSFKIRSVKKPQMTHMTIIQSDSKEKLKPKNVKFSDIKLKENSFNFNGPIKPNQLVLNIKQFNVLH